VRGPPCTKPNSTRARPRRRDRTTSHVTRHSSADRVVGRARVTHVAWPVGVASPRATVNYRRTAVSPRSQYTVYG